MTTVHDKRTASRWPAGFSMIDVLVAIVVLTVGLLALGVLQAGLTRNAADSLARSQLAAFTEGLIEQARSSGKYDDIASGTIVPNSAGTPVQKAAYAAQNAAHVSNLRTTQTVTTYYANAAGSFSTTVQPGDPPQYKKLDLTTTWTDASGTNRTLALNTIISPVTIDDSRSIFDHNLNPPDNTAQTPIVRQDNPVGPGVIPIAVGNGNDTAATNPKPEISAKSGQIKGTTSYNVLTYHNANNNLAEMQRRVETLVVSCSCKFGAANQTTGVFAQAYRPTYWDGTRYVPPQPTRNPPLVPEGPDPPPAAGEDPNITVAQSPYCTECCRDHHDTTDAKVKFDALRTNFGKYKYDASNTLVASSDSYVNACRLIRVDGIFHTATDLQSSHMGLLATAILDGKTQPATSPVPIKTYADLYSKFVVDYLHDSYVTATPPAVSAVDANAMYAEPGRHLTEPDSIDITRTTSDIRYLHARGLYVDRLEAPTIDAIKRNCAGANLTSDCVLPMLPFTTINTTELADWAPGADNTSALQVFTAPTCKDPTGLTNPTVDFPIRGCAAAGTASGTVYAVASIGRSNAGVAIARPVDPQDDRATRTAQQKFNVPNSSGGGSGGGGSGGGSGGGTGGGGGTVMVSWTGLTVGNYDASTYPLVSWSTSAGQLGCANSAAKKKPDPNPYTCMPSSLTGVTITVGAPPVGSPGGYNTTVYTKGADPCANGNTNIPHCPKYQVSTITLNGSGVTPGVTVVGAPPPGRLSEGSFMTFASLRASDQISIGFKQTNSGNDQASYSCIPDPNNANKQITQWTPCTP